MRGFHTAALVALVALALCVGGAADNNTPLTRGASNIGTAPARPSLNISATTSLRAQEAQEPKAGSFVVPLPAGTNPTPVGADRPNTRGNRYKNKRKPNKPYKNDTPDKHDTPHNPTSPSLCGGSLKTCNGDSDCLTAFPCKIASCSFKKKEKHKYKRSDDNDEKDHPEQYERYQSIGTCVCTGDKDGACLPPVPFPDDCSSKQTDIGTCDAGICTTEPRDDGCPCGAQSPPCDTAENSACLNSNQPCKCNGNQGSPLCVPNLLPVGTICSERADGCNVGKCDANGNCLSETVDNGTPCEVSLCDASVDSDCLINTATKCICDEGTCEPNLVPYGTPCTEDMLADCEVAQCQGSECVKIADTAGTPCFQGGDPLCINAGICIINANEEPECKLLDCEGPEPSTKCKYKQPGDSCSSANQGKICCPLPNYVNDGNQECINPGVVKTCPCSNVADDVCVFEGDYAGFCCPLGNGNFECKVNEQSCPAASACANRHLGDACVGGNGICCVNLQDAGTPKNPNLLCNTDTSTCECGTCEFKDTTFGTNTAYCSDTGASLSEPCKESCGTCSVEVEGPITDSFCNDAASCVDKTVGFPSVNQLCPGSTTCIACKKESNSGGCAPIDS